MTPIEFHSRVLKLALEKGLKTVVEIEDKAGFPRGTIKNWKNAIPSGDKIVKLADALDLSIDYIFARTSCALAHKVDLNETGNLVICAISGKDLNSNQERSILNIVNSIEDLKKS